MPSCVAYGCSNRMSGKTKRQKLEEETQKVTFNRFPKCPEKQKAWVHAVSRDKWTPSQRSVICSAHFEEKYFDRTSLMYVRLRENAVSTIFKAFPSYMQKKNVCRKQPKTRMSGVSTNIETPSTSQEAEINVCKECEKIAYKYFDVRLHYIGKRAIDNADSNRQHYNKLILFQGR